jgi:gluconolactonase
MPIEVLSPGMRRIVSATQEPELLASGFGGQWGPGEGPVWFKEGGYLLFTDIHNDRRLRYTPGEGVTVDQQGTGRANGQTRDRLGRLVACHHDLRRVDRIESDGSMTVIANNYRGLRLNRPNDVVVKSDGAVYFTDPPPRPGITQPDATPELDLAGVYRVSPDLGRINLLVRDFINPNGLAFSPDEKILYINCSQQRHVRAFDVDDYGMLNLHTDRIFFKPPVQDRRGVPDGMKVDVEGNLYCTGPGGIWVVAPSGEPLGVIVAPATNMAWGDDDWSTMYFVGSAVHRGAGNLYRIRLNIPGVPVPRGTV